jgi:hypothetical protein
MTHTAQRAAQSHQRLPCPETTLTISPIGPRVPAMSPIQKNDGCTHGGCPSHGRRISHGYPVRLCFALSPKLAGFWI